MEPEKRGVARVFFMNQALEKPQEGGDAMSGTPSIFNIPVTVLFDSRATHSLSP